MRCPAPPPHAAQGISEASVPAELFPQCCTLEYAPPRQGALAPPAYIFVIDTCVAEEELAACKTAVQQALTMIPEYALVGLVTFGTHVHVHELGFQECPKAYVFRGTKDYTPQQVRACLPACVRRGWQGMEGAGEGGGRDPPAVVVMFFRRQRRPSFCLRPRCPPPPSLHPLPSLAQVQDQLGLASAGMRRGAGPPSPMKQQQQPAAPGARPGNRFVLPLTECEFVVGAALEELQRDAFPAVPAHRPARCLGTALQVAAALAGGCLPPGGSSARLMLLVGGPCTEGSGKVVEKELSEPIRWERGLCSPRWPTTPTTRACTTVCPLLAHLASLQVPQGPGQGRSPLLPQGSQVL